MSAFQLHLLEEDIANLCFNQPQEKVNTLSIPILEELEAWIDKIAADSSIRAVLLTSGKQDTFIAGADLRTFLPAFQHPDAAQKIVETGHRVFTKWSALPQPTIAVIHGACLGGGLEYALSCSYRLASDHLKTQIGLPEVSLGIFPGWGGTQRLPRLIGLTAALPLITGGKIVNGKQAYKLHIADALIPAEFLLPRAHAFAKSVLHTKEQKKREAARAERPFLSRCLENNPLGRSLLFYQAKRQIEEKTKGHYIAPLLALKSIEQGFGVPLKQGLQKEQALFLSQIPQGFPQAQPLIDLFFTQEALKKEVPAASPLPIETTAVIGAGIMGSSISWLLANHELSVRMKEMNWELLGKGMANAYGLFQKGIKAKKIFPYQAAQRFLKITGTIDYSGFHDSQLVLEAATEDLALKQKIFAQIETIVNEKTIIATNTSSLTISSMEGAFIHPERFLGLHFFNPVVKMPLVEVVAGKKTSQEVINTALFLCKRLGKTPLVVGDCAGFLVNRILMQGAREAAYMLEEGYDPLLLENAITQFGLPMGPFTLADEVGNDVIYKVALSLAKAYGPRMEVPKLMEQLYVAKLFGKKTHTGFYLYKGKKKSWNPAIKTFYPPTKNALPQENILPRFLYSMINEAARCLEEKILTRPDFLDMGLVLGMGFPPFRGGLLRYADRIGTEQILSILKKFEQFYGPRFTPAPYLVELSKTRKKFY